MANCKENERKTILANCLWGGACQKGHREGRGREEGARMGFATGQGKAGRGRLPGEATWQCLQHNLNNSDAICHTSYGIPCHTTGHTLSYHVPFYIWSRLANRSAAQLKGSNSHSNFAISAGSTCLTFFTSFSLTTPQSCPLHLPLSSLLLHPLNSVYNLFCKFFNCFSNCLRQNFREIKFFIFLQQNYFQLCKLPELRECVGVYV